MEFPDEILAIIKEFSRPVTRPDWRHLHRLTSLDLHIDIARKVSWNCPTVIMRFAASSPGDYIFNIIFFGSPYVNIIYKRGGWIPICI